MRDSGSYNSPNYTPFHDRASIFAPKQSPFILSEKKIIMTLIVLIAILLAYFTSRLLVEKHIFSFYKHSNSTPTPQAFSATQTITTELSPTANFLNKKSLRATPTKGAGSIFTPPNPTNPPNTPVPPTSTPEPTETPTPLPPDTTPPVITNMGGPANGSTINVSSFCFPLTITDDRSHEPNIWTQYTFDTNVWTAWSNDQQTAYSPCFNDIHEGEHIFSVHAKDEAGNISSMQTSDFRVSINSNN